MCNADKVQTLRESSMVAKQAVSKKRKDTWDANTKERVFNNQASI